MIQGTARDFERYQTLSPAMKPVAEFIRGTDWTRKEPGRYDVPGLDAYINLSENVHADDNDSFETHRDFVDLQFIADGDEKMRWAHIDGLEPETEYDAARDFRLFSGEAGGEAHLRKGDWVLFFPEDAHAPLIRLASGRSLKVVAKIPVKYF